MGNKKSKLTQKIDPELMKEYQRMTTFSADEIEEWYEEFNKQCSADGKINYIDFKHIFVQYFHGEIATKFCDAIFYMFDEDKKRDLDFGEFLLALSPLSQLKFRDHLELIFDVYTSPNNEEINKVELRKIIKIMFKLVGQEKFFHNESVNSIVSDIVNALGKKDGTNLFNKKEVIEWCYNSEEIRHLLVPYVPVDDADSNKTTCPVVDISATTSANSTNKSNTQTDKIKNKR